jgi:hypothetical protein
MSIAGRIGLVLLGSLLGVAIGAGAGLLGGLGYTELARTSGFEGHSGFVVAFWILGGIVIGLILGIVMALRLARR